MKRKYLMLSLILATLLVSVFNIAYVIHDTFYDSITYLPKGEFLYSSMSPDGETTVSVYRVEIPTGHAIRGAIVSLDDSGNVNEKNIFWQIGVDNAIVGWHDNNVVSINSCLIDITTDNFYDSRYKTKASV